MNASWRLSYPKQPMKQLAYPYFRVSTKRQGKEGYSLAAQRKAVEDYARANGIRLGKAYIEIESGRKKHRPVLERAIATCKANGGLLLIAKLDRLSRSEAFIATLRESDVVFRAVDNPHADKFTIHILAAVAEKESDDIRQRTTAALQVAKERGVQLGRFGKEVLSVRNREAATAFALRMRLPLYRLKKQGFTTVRAIAGELNRLAMPTYRKGRHRWHPATVHNVLKILDAAGKH